MKHILAIHVGVVLTACLSAGELPTVKQFRLVDVAGKAHTQTDWRGKKAVVLVFLGADCPISNGYAPEFQKLDADYGSKGVLFYGVHCDPDTSSDDAAKHAKEYGLKFPILIDHEHAVAKAVGASRTPEAVVLTPDGKVVYRGRIDNKYEQNGKRRDEPTERYLRAALDSHLAGKPVPTSETKAVGCPIHGPK